MKLILSRKGFDSSAGGVPSPIFSDGRMVSLPIPDRASPIRYADVRLPDGGSMGELVASLTDSRVPAHHLAHLDPDLCPASIPRAPGWRPMLGQAGAAQGHLRKQGVGPGDLFLFFGLFRDVHPRGGRWRYLAGSHPQHVLFGWLQIADVRPVSAASARELPWASQHPHLHHAPGRGNTLYLAAERLILPCVRAGLPGAGLFPEYDSRLRLTSPGATRPGQWRLPRWFSPSGRRSRLSFHAADTRWTNDQEHVELRCAARGQEFVLDCDDYPEALPWVASLVAR